jgi:hypothetical protein
MRSHLVLIVAAALAASCAEPRPPLAAEASAPQPYPAVAIIHRGAQSLRPFVQTEWVRQFLKEALTSQSIGKRTFFHDSKKERYFTPEEAAALPAAERDALVKEEVDDEIYWARYSDPLAYARPLDLLGQAGFDPSGRRLIDFGYGNIGQLKFLAQLGADATGIEVDPLLPKLYADDVGPVRGTMGAQGNVRLLHGYFPTDEALVREVGGGYDLFLSKNVLKRGAIHPEQPVQPKHHIDLGVSDDAFVARLYGLLNPGGRVLIYNICPAPAPAGQPYISWADGRSPFSRDAWSQAGFRVVEFDRDDTPAVRQMARLLGWEETMDVENNLFALYTLVEKPHP